MKEAKKAFTAARIFDGFKMHENAAIQFEGDKIESIINCDEVPADVHLQDFGECTIAPGFIDLQIYGSDGFLFSEYTNAQALNTIADSLVKTGTTGFVICLATNDIKKFKEAAKVVREVSHPAVLGVHFEGPYINPAKKGAHLEQYIRQATISEIEDLLEATGDVLKIMTVAPECCGPQSIQLLANAGVLVSAGHSNAAYAQAQEGFAAGIKAATHLFNAMSPLHHRDTGLPGAVFLNRGVSASIIADGIHVDFETLKISKSILGERLFLITDAVTETHEGPYRHVEQSDRFTLPDGTLSGSKLTLLQAVKNCVEIAGIDLEEALRMATFYPARLLRREDIGVIKKGNYADVVVFDDRFQLKAVGMRGEVKEV